ncbi:hypothetical protein NDR87_11320 [Nocardia sp. CDC159]|uniref:Uncharacterized protein n=1 Tax=Nocardia pulmonis TaxID=2951408 RepID=A0A9X2E4M5_9NOCA|nr:MULTISPECIES: hypothetical protein [Nocardia]MCM6774062.1 hypothetical protein [Nocardia pulmonis]MCM6786949.1 hypothetical protein [Nocardia sp. CDC159]
MPRTHIVDPPPRPGAVAVSPPSLNRRSMLRIAGGSVLAAGALSAAACSQEAPPEPDILLAQEQSARTDAVWARAAAAVAPQRTAALTLIANQRTEHADALRAEIDRALGVYGDGTKPRSGTPPVAEPPALAPPPTLAALRDQLTRSQRSAADLAATLSGYRAGLLASISACCATHAGVLLA